MASPTEHPPNAYLPIDTYPDYQNFSYHFDYVSIITVATFICFIPTVITTTNMIIFYQKNLSRNFSKEIHPYVFKSFLYMQSSNIIYTTLDFFLVRIPSTSLVTSYFYSMKPDSIIRYVVAAFYGYEYLSQLFTVLFCFIRVLVLFNPRKRLEMYDFIFMIWLFLSLVLSFVASFPHIKHNSMGMQLDVPFQYGAMFLTTTFAYGNSIQTIGNGIFSIIVTIAIVVMTSLMVSKLKTLKLMNNSSNRKRKAEKTLTITMFIILIPAIFTQVLAISSLFATSFSCYIILARPIVLDCRVTIVSCYFFLTHPYFKKKFVSQTITIRPLSNC
ncbi:hypothetical protein CRE_04784 [Caenorhabditis remanei]|uniref:Serpentine Receptor, class U n=1 Tax=Caenorhabditis remanei TaxID=31234 RepID=E3LZ86_CAERE|nr:hypothetical protein CRE_04784 [Caenorhabditis remanei]